MKNFLSRFVWAILIGVALYGAYRAYVHWWGDPGLKKATQNIQKKIAGTVEDTSKRYINKAKEEATQGIGDFFKEKTGDVLRSLGDSLESTANSLLGATSTTQKKFLEVSDISGAKGTVAPTPKDNTFFIPPPPATIITKANVPLIFSINRRITYNIDWGDGRNEEGTVFEDSIRLISHAWGAKGDYTVKMVIREGERVDTSFFPVRVYE